MICMSSLPVNTKNARCLAPLLACLLPPCQSRAPAVNGVHYTTRGDYIHVIRNDEIRTPRRRRHGTSGSGPAKFLLRAGNLVILDEALVLVRDGWTDERD